MAKRSIVHVEIPAADREAASQFYGEIFGFDEFNPLPFGYTYFKTGNTIGGFPDLALGSWNWWYAPVLKFRKLELNWWA